ncbi:MAG TPA: methylmalonic aciduria and homocystinuria type D protein [Oscillatoriales cyanobacterium M59_W2019_021]|nr:MAG: methylmalonic aciduria and homocystinuria type D protein [Cyanobacteria bacterium J055]HIK33668.1 methylmalonic aciduria and homocystinuria type D protein [Oscillatoriales cyanobacterium M4454_W2019_049]HIK52670.1 methylmalonic aciduria and homocystinuria type D protein [Oscillatoriales cyanobacterium M59_W2019_021]
MLLSQPNATLEIRLCQPSAFVRQHQSQIFPTWNEPIASIILILQKSRFPLPTDNPELEAEKEQLRERFLRWAFPRVCQLRDRDFLTDLIDPRSGYPLFSNPGEIRHDDVAAVAATLGWEIASVGNCRAIVHPQWRTAVYPATLLSTASLPVLQSVLNGDRLEL